MENHLLVEAPQRLRWPQHVPSFAQGVSLLRDPLKSGTRNIRHNQIHDKIDDMISRGVDTFRNGFDDHWTYGTFGPWVTALLYTPFKFVGEAINNAFMAFLSLPPLFTMVIFPLLVCYVVNRIIRRATRAYQTFLDLGRGGTPSTPMGLIRVTVKAFFAGVDVLDPPHVPPMLDPYRGKLFGLQQRPGERPTVKGVAPQRQFTQKTPVETFAKLMRKLEDAAKDNENLHVTTSYLEGHTDALKCIFPDRPHEVWGTDSEWDFEIAHPHRVDGSMHMILHPEDVKTVVEAGWGERHPLATDSWLWKMFYHHVRCKRRPVPYNLVLVYAPRNEAEFKIVDQLLEAAIWFHREKDVCDQINLGLVARTTEGTLLSRDDALGSGEWVVGPDGRLITMKRAMERGLYRDSSAGASVVRALGAGCPTPISIKSRTRRV